MWAGLFQQQQQQQQQPPQAKKPSKRPQDAAVVAGGSRKKKKKKKSKDQPAAAAAPATHMVKNQRASRELNSTLARLARGKQLTACRAAFASGSAAGSTDSWSHAILINAHATCGDGDGALAALAAMRAAGHRPCVMSYTAALKANCKAGDLDVARRVLSEMEAEFAEQAPHGGDDWTPNVRTANTFFRGCLVAGAVDDATALLRRLGRGVWAGAAAGAGETLRGPSYNAAPCARLDAPRAPVSPTHPRAQPQQPGRS